MAEYTDKLELYLPSVDDSDIEVPESLRDNFQKIDDGFVDIEQELRDLGLQFNEFTDLNGIEEMGSNENGHFIRWKNGFQICWSDIIRMDSTEPIGALYRSNYFESWYYPAPFDDNYPIAVTSSVRNSIHSWAINTGTPYNGYTPVRRMSAIRTRDKMPIQIVALGRWK